MLNDAFKTGPTTVEAELAEKDFKAPLVKDEHAITGHHSYWSNRTVTRI